MMFVEAHLERRLPCSLIMCDIDRFKQVNDTYGHQAGDEAIKSFAQILKSCCHPGDLVARYGGEEFVMLCADCNNTTAASRAEQLRKSFHELSQPAIGGKCCSASFGVTELQPGDNSADDAQSCRSRLADGQRRRPQHGGATGQRHERRTSAKRAVAGGSGDAIPADRC